MDTRSVSRQQPHGGGWLAGLLAAGWVLAAAGIAAGSDVAVPSPGDSALAAGAPPIAGAAIPADRSSDRHREELRAGKSSCGSCASEEGARVNDLGEAGIESLGLRMSVANDSAWNRVDGLFRAGALGDPKAGETKQRAVTHFLLRSHNALHYMAELACDSLLHRFRESDLQGPFGERYANTTVFPIRFLQEGLIGEGRFCLRYELGHTFDERVMLGGVPARMRSDLISEDEGTEPRPAVSVVFSSDIHKSVELLFTSDVCGRVRRETIIDRGDTLELITVTDLEGMYVRYAGMHRLGALVYWRSVVAGGAIRSGRASEPARTSRTYPCGCRSSCPTWVWTTCGSSTSRTRWYRWSGRGPTRPRPG